MEALPSLTPQQPQSTVRSITSSTGASLFTIHSFEVDEWWPLIELHMRRWIAFDETWSVDGVKDEIKSARAQLWCIHKDLIVGVIVTRIHETDSVKVGHVWGCGGDLKPVKAETIEFFRVVEDWFREKGCKFVDWTGREGWQKILPDYERHAVVMRKRL